MANPVCVFCFETIWYFLHLNEFPAHCKKPGCIDQCKECNSDFEAIGEERKAKDKSVILMQEDVRLARDLGESFYKSNLLNNVKSRQMGNDCPLCIHIRGVAVEIAVGKYLDIPFDRSVGPRSGGIDLKMPDGRTIDAKGTKYSPPWVNAVVGKAKHPCDIYIVATGQIPKFIVQAWTTKEVLFREENLTDLGYGKIYCEKNPYPIEQLK